MQLPHAGDGVVSSHHGRGGPLCESSLLLQSGPRLLHFHASPVGFLSCSSLSYCLYLLLGPPYSFGQASVFSAQASKDSLMGNSTWFPFYCPTKDLPLLFIWEQHHWKLWLSMLVCSGRFPLCLTLEHFFPMYDSGSQKMESCSPDHSSTAPFVGSTDHHLALVAAESLLHIAPCCLPPRYPPEEPCSPFPSPWWVVVQTAQSAAATNMIVWWLSALSRVHFI